MEMDTLDLRFEIASRDFCNNPRSPNMIKKIIYCFK